jgi:hypothetical protein
MSNLVEQILDLSDFKLLLKELDLGLVDKIFVTTDGVVAEIPRDAIHYAYTPQGEYILLGDFCSIGEHEIDLMISDDDSDALTILTRHGQVIMLEPNSHIIASEMPLTFQMI